MCIEKKRLEKREKLHLAQEHLHATIAKHMKTFNESNTLLLEGLPPKDVQVTLAHLVKPY